MTMVHHGSVLSSTDPLGQTETVAVEPAPATEVLVEYRDAYREMIRLRRSRSFSSSDPLYAADRERAQAERRVMTMADAVHRRARAVSIDLHEARDRSPEAVLEALEEAIERHDALSRDGAGRFSLSNRGRLGLLVAVGVTTVLVAFAWVTQTI
jgi:hypothetical protein